MDRDRWWLVEEQHGWASYELAPISSRRRMPPEYVLTIRSPASVKSRRSRTSCAGPGVPAWRGGTTGRPARGSPARSAARRPPRTGRPGRSRAQAGRVVHHVVAGDPGPTGVRSEEGGQDPDQGRLSRSRWDRGGPKRCLPPPAGRPRPGPGSGRTAWPALRPR